MTFLYFALPFFISLFTFRFYAHFKCFKYYAINAANAANAVDASLSSGIYMVIIYVHMYTCTYVCAEGQVYLSNYYFAYFCCFAFLPLIFAITKAELNGISA